MRALRLLLLPVVLLAGTACSAAAQGVPAELRAFFSDTAVSRYRLTEEGMAKFRVATAALGPLREAGAAIDARFRAMQGGGLAALTETFDSEPTVRAAIAASGLTTREYLQFMLAMLRVNVALAEGNATTGNPDDDAVLAGNILFLATPRQEEAPGS